MSISINSASQSECVRCLRAKIEVEWGGMVEADETGMTDTRTLCGRHQDAVRNRSKVGGFYNVFTKTFELR